MAKHFITDAPQVNSHLVFTEDFNSGYYNMIDKINAGGNIELLAKQLREEPANNNMSDYFYDKGQWAAILDNK